MTETASPALKEIFDRARIRHFADETKAIWPGFDADTFVAYSSDGVDDLGIMQRMRRVAEAFGQTLPDDLPRAIAILTELAPRIRHGFASIALCEYVAMSGRSDTPRALEALRVLTRYGSAEFAIRPFLRDDLAGTLRVMRGWADDENEHVRRLASEGARPRLPWSFQLTQLVGDPSPALPILDALRADDSVYVRKSVANHLNDIGKDHPDCLVAHLDGWDRADTRTGWIARHALRSLIKQGDRRALALVGVSGTAQARIERFEVSPTELLLGERLTLSARIASTGDTAQRIVADYAIHYVKKSGRPSRKVFKWKELSLAPGAVADLSISQTIRDFTTRTHNAGHHRVELMLNGETVAEGGFDLSL